MPWRESSPMSERLAFIRACLNRRERIVDICDRFGISEKTGQKWLQRFRSEGEGGLVDRSHAPRTHQARVHSEIADRILALRRKHPLYGPRKLYDWLVQHDPQRQWPVPSTIGELLKRAGLIRPRRRRLRPVERQLHHASAVAHQPNDVWTADFKGQFILGGRNYCYPLTVLDLYSHYLLRCVALSNTSVPPSRRVFLSLFRELGLPTVIRTDNGIPFAQPNALGRMGALAFWWVRLGIRPDHIRPARPAENGAHERFHKTLKASTAAPPAATFTAQQRRFDRFGAEYNGERPHEGLPHHVPPAKVYRPSPRAYPDRLPPLAYPGADAVRLVDPGGSIKWRDQALFLSTNLSGDYVGLTVTPSDLVRIEYAQLALGHFDPHLGRFIPHVEWLG